MRNKGITLIALIITIIVLLILAGVALASLSGENGLLKRANEAKKESEKESIREQIQLEVYGSYENDGNLELNILKENIEKNIPEAQVTGEEFPITVVEKGYIYQVDEEGKVEYLGQGVIPVVNKGSIKITKEDGNTPEKGTVDEGTALKIEFSASIEGGKITKVEPGNLTEEDGKITYTTDGNEKEVIFTITGEVEGEEHQIKYKISVKDYYKKLCIEAEDITKNATTYYGAEVRGYPVDKGVDKWRIFYADETNIYLIADNYISYEDAPLGKNGTAVTDAQGYIRLQGIEKDYTEGVKWIYDNSKAKKWLSEFFDYTTDGGKTYPNRTGSGVEHPYSTGELCYLMDTNVWSKFQESNLADYAIGGATIELFKASWDQTHPDKPLVCSLKNGIGYTFQRGDGKDTNFGEIYTKKEPVWLASPYVTNGYLIFSNSIGLDYSMYDSRACLRPLVCLKTGIQLEKVAGEENVYEIK